MHFLFAFPDLSSPEIWMSLVTLTFLEIVLGVDNIIFISIAANKVPEEDQDKARNIGLFLAMILRILMLFGIAHLIAMQKPLFTFDKTWLHGGLSGQSLILIAGGIFLLYKSTTEIHHKLGGEADQVGDIKPSTKKTLTSAIIQIALINIVFSFDSILTAIGLTKDIGVMMIAVILSMIIMMVFAGKVGRFVNDHPTIQMLGLSFLILIGFMLIVEGVHLGDLTVLGNHVGAVPKGYLYFAIAFSLSVEFLNIRLRKKTDPVQLHGPMEDAIEDGIEIEGIDIDGSDD